MISTDYLSEPHAPASRRTATVENHCADPAPREHGDFVAEEGMNHGLSLNVRSFAVSL